MLSDLAGAPLRAGPTLFRDVEDHRRAVRLVTSAVVAARIVSDRLHDRLAPAAVDLLTRRLMVVVDPRSRSRSPATCDMILCDGCRLRQHDHLLELALPRSQVSPRRRSTERRLPPACRRSRRARAEPQHGHACSNSARRTSGSGTLIVEADCDFASLRCLRSAIAMALLPLRVTPRFARIARCGRGGKLTAARPHVANAA